MVCFGEEATNIDHPVLGKNTTNPNLEKLAATVVKETTPMIPRYFTMPQYSMLFSLNRGTPCVNCQRLMMEHHLIYLF